MVVGRELYVFIGRAVAMRIHRQLLVGGREHVDIGVCGRILGNHVATIPALSASYGCDSEMMAVVIAALNPAASPAAALPPALE
jgi:hypothetical protein